MAIKDLLDSFYKIAGKYGRTCARLREACSCMCCYVAGNLVACF